MFSPTAPLFGQKVYERKGQESAPCSPKSYGARTEQPALANRRKQHPRFTSIEFLQVPRKSMNQTGGGERSDGSGRKGSLPDGLRCRL